MVSTKSMIVSAEIIESLYHTPPSSDPSGLSNLLNALDQSQSEHVIIPDRMSTTLERMDNEHRVLPDPRHVREWQIDPLSAR